MKRLALILALAAPLAAPADPITTLAVTIGPRPAGSPAEAAAARAIADWFTDLGLRPAIQPFSFPAPGYPLARIPSQNVVATIPGTDPNAGTLYLGAHYDTLADSPGANDNAAGIAALLDVARVLVTAPISPSVTLIAFGAQDGFLWGGRAFVAGMTARDRLFARGMIALDCVGVGDRRFLMNQGDPRLADLARDAATDPIVMRGGGSEHQVFTEAGIQAVLIGSADQAGVCGAVARTVADTPDTVDRAAVRASTRLTLAVLRARAAEPLAVDRVYLPLIRLLEVRADLRYTGS